MRVRSLDTDLAQTLAWIWLGFLIVGLLVFLVYRSWRKRHPPPAPERELSYSQRLQQRLSRKLRDGVKEEQTVRPSKDRKRYR